tara:strand:- start:69 stop:371 length:303 start_codon:yes stop_codon:yes gene_type:complete
LLQAALNTLVETELWTAVDAGYGIRTSIILQAGVKLAWALGLSTLQDWVLRAVAIFGAVVLVLAILALTVTTFSACGRQASCLLHTDSQLDQGAVKATLL